MLLLSHRQGLKSSQDLCMCRGLWGRKGGGGGGQIEMYYYNTFRRDVVP